MKKTFLQLFLLLLSIFFVVGVNAQEENYNERWTCLDATLATEDEEVPPISATAGEPYQKYTHAGILRTKGAVNSNPAPNANTYIVECVQIPTTLVIPEAVKQELNYQIPQEVCTTSDSETDIFIWNNDRLKLLQKLFSGWDYYQGWNYLGYTPDGYYKFDFITKLEPENTNHYFQTDDQGNFKTGPFAYVNYILGSAERKFLAYNRLAKEIATGYQGLGAQQQATIKFTFEGAKTDCVSISWDPYGRVFDSQTLEPIPGVDVTLKIKKDNIFRNVVNEDVPGKFIINPFLTKEDGRFSFIVPDGTYKLNAAMPGYQFPNSAANLHPNYKNIYSDIYRGENILQKGAMVHRDIPLDPVGPGQKYQPKIIGIFQTILTDGITVVDGEVSHPLALVRAYCKKTTNTKGTLNTEVQADKNGVFKIRFNPDKCQIDQGETYGILEVEAVDLTSSLKSFKSIYQVLAAESPKRSSLVLNPIFNYVEGDAYDSKGQLMANATVGVYAIGDKNPYRTVTTDSKGHYVLTSNQLPGTPYNLKYTSAGKINSASVTVSTSRYLAQNLPTIKKNHTNLYSYKIKEGETQPNKTVAQNNANKTGTTENKKNINNNQSLILVFAIILVLIGASIGAVGIYFLKKRDNQSINT